MAVRHDAAKRAQAAGFGTISNQLGADVLEQLILSHKHGTVCVSPIEWEHIALDTPMISRLKPKNTNSNSNQSIESSSHVDPTDLLNLIRQAAADTIGRTIADDAPLLESGLDSIGSVSLRNKIASRLNVELSSAFVFEYPDINSMVRYISSLSSRVVRKNIADNNQTLSDLPVLVIGAGIGGLSFARQLEKAGLSVIIMDKADRVGGVWHSLANISSKLQIDSPAYDFDSTFMPSSGDHRWKSSFPQQGEILNGCENIADSMFGAIYLKTHVQKVKKLNDMEYEVTYRRDGREQFMKVSGVITMTGGLHRPVLNTFPNENKFGGHIGLGIANDTPLHLFKDASVVIVGHGAFAVENMRTAFENGAKHVTILCRRRQLVFSTFCNWLLNSNKGVMPVTDVVEIMRPFYKACGINIEDLPSISRDNTGELMLDQTTVPAGSDLYFLAQMLGKLDIVVDEATSFTSDAVLTKDGHKIKANVFLKCLGSHTDDSIILDIFGKDTKIQGLWINGDPNLFTYNDGAQVPRKVKTLMCSSYAFFVQSFALAYLKFRKHRDEFQKALNRINTDSPTSSDAERILIELWDFVEPAKRTVAERTMELCPFDRFQVERETEWENYSHILDASPEKSKTLWQLMQPIISIIHRRNPSTPTETRSQHLSLGSLSVFIPRHRRVLFLPGQGTNARLARTLLERTGWIGRSNLDFIIPDAPYEMPAFTNEEQLRQIGLDGLVAVGLYDKNARYREWRAGFEALYEHHHYDKPIQVTEADRKQWNMTLAYLRDIVEKYGPFDGIAGFCEGAAVASVALHLQARGEDQGLGAINFFIAMSPWRSPMHNQEDLFQPDNPLQLPMLQIVGENDMDVFLTAAPYFRSDYADASEFRHNGQHIYPPLTPGLERKLQQLLNNSDGKFVIEPLNV
jgi:thioredoxin reductase/aryl carrier-like protein